MPASRVYRDLACPDGREIGGDAEEAREQAGAPTREPVIVRFISHMTLQAQMRGFVLSFSFFHSLLCADEWMEYYHVEQVGRANLKRRHVME